MLKCEVTCPRSGQVELGFELRLPDSQILGFQSKHHKTAENSLATSLLSNVLHLHP